ncbi:MAG: hypothetical protein WC383_16025 [Gammaproteobacteria bacterium]
MYKTLAKYAYEHYQYRLLSDDELIHRQMLKFNRVFSHACKYVPFYSTLYRRNDILGKTLHYPDELDLVPIVTKKDFRSVPHNELVSQVPMGRVNRHFTSGSTGEPFLVEMSKQAEYTAHMRIFFTLLRHGYDPSKRMLILSRYESDSKFEVERDIGLLKTLQKSIGLFDRRIVSIYQNQETIVRSIMRFKPYVMVSTPGVLSILINHLKTSRIRLEVPLLFLTSETITPVFLREIHEYLGSTVIDMYGCMECPSIGYEVNGSGKRYVSTESCLVELESVDDNAPTQSNVIITNLLNHIQPVIRYSVGDRALGTQNRTKCIRALGKITGRVDDIIKTVDGTIIAHHHAYEMFMDFVECRQYKFLQKDNQVTLLLVVDQGEDEECIIREANARLNRRYPSAKIGVEIVDEILPDPNTGKIKNIEVIQ